jgi:hypothetical protein
MPFISVFTHPEPQAVFTDEQKAVFAKLRGIRFSTEKGGVPRQILDSNLRIMNGCILGNKKEVEKNKNAIAKEINKAIGSSSSNKIHYIDFTLFGYDKSKESEHRLRTYKPDSTLRIGIHSRNDMETEDITDKYDQTIEFNGIAQIEGSENIKITLYDLTDDMYNSVLELNKSFLDNSNEIIRYDKLAGLTAATHALSINGNFDELSGKSIIFKSARDYIGDDSENVLLFDFLGHKNNESGDTADIITEDLDTAARILHDCIWLINISERGRPDGSSQYDLHTRINITLAFSKCKNPANNGSESGKFYSNDSGSGKFYVNGVDFKYEAYDDFADLISAIDVDSEGVLQDPNFPSNIGADNPGNILILNRYLGTIARYKVFDENGEPNEWFKTYLKLITNMSDVDFYEFASEILRNIMIICSQKELGVTLFKMARTRFCAKQYCHTEIDPTFPVNLNIPRFIPIEPLEVETDCGCPNKGNQQS